MVDLSKMTGEQIGNELESLVRHYQSLGPDGLTEEMKAQIEKYAQAYFEKEKRYYQRPFVRYQSPRKL
jgi:hypothetical protein